MHKTQQQLLQLVEKHENFGSLSLRNMAELIGAPGKPQTVKHHLEQLEKAGLIQLNLRDGAIKLVKQGFNTTTKSPLYSLPVYGAANCGPATIFADQRVEGFLKMSSSLLPRNKKGLFVLRASGSSMNLAKIDGKTIEDGDFVIVDGDYKSFKDKDIIVAVIDGMANIKRYRMDRVNNCVVLESESTDDYLPILIHEGDDFLLNGKVVGIIKKMITHYEK